MKRYNFIIYILLIVFTFGCASKDPDTIIAGKESKTWETKKEFTAEGKKDKLTKGEKDEIIQFYSNGTFAAKGATQAINGTWDYQDRNKNLSLQFTGANFTENFTVLKLKKNEMKLKAEDGSTMVMRPM